MATMIDKIEQENIKTNLPSISVGDTVVVSKEIIEGEKKRIQKFEGVVVRTAGTKNKKSIVVRKIVDAIGVEKSFLIHSPLVKEIQVKQKGKVRRSKLYYLRDRIGRKATRIKSAE
jgi:large subunit ribosomal protein L19